MTNCPYCAQPNPAQATACASCGNPLHEKLLAGTMLGNGRYRIEHDLGQGGFGITYKAFDTNLHVAVAIKEFYPSLDGVHARRGTNNRVMIPGNTVQEFEKYRQQTLTEARTLRGLGTTRNPAIVKVQDLLEENNTAYIVMEFLEGQTLGSRIQSGQLLNEAESRDMLAQLLGALGQLHQQNILHLDIKPDNIVLTQTGPVLIDFGAYRSIQTGTQRTTNALTHGYAPLEQYSVTTDLKPSTDLYALGATFYHALVGKPPSSATDRIKNRFDPRDALRQRTSEPFALWLAKSLEMHQHQRPNSASLFWQDIPSDKGGPDKTTRTGKGKTRVPASISGTLALITTLGVFAGGYWWLEQSKPKTSIPKPVMIAPRVAKSAPTGQTKTPTPPMIATTKPAVPASAKSPTQPAPVQPAPVQPTASENSPTGDAQAQRDKLEAAQKAANLESEKAKAAQTAAAQAQAQANEQAKQLELERQRLATAKLPSEPATTPATATPKTVTPKTVAAKPVDNSKPKPRDDIRQPTSARPAQTPKVEARVEPQVIAPSAKPQVDRVQPVEPARTTQPAALPATLPAPPVATLPLTVEFAETFRVSYPSGWTASNNTRDGGNDTRWTTAAQPVGQMIVHVNTQPGESPNLQAMTEALTRNIATNRSGYLQIKSQEDTLAGEPGWRSEYQIKNGQILTRGYTLAAIHDNRLYVLQLEAPFEQFANYWPVFERVRNSFQYL